MTAFADPDPGGRHPDGVAPETIRTGRVVKFFIGKDYRVCQAVVVVAIVAGTRPLAATVEWKSGTAFRIRRSRRSRVGRDVMAVPDTINDIAMTERAISG